MSARRSAENDAPSHDHPTDGDAWAVIRPGCSACVLELEDAERMSAIVTGVLPPAKSNGGTA